MRQNTHGVGKAWIALPILFLVACQARPLPPVATLSPPLVTLTEHLIRVDEWTIPRLGGWRVVTSQANAPLVIIQVSPDEQQIITFATQPQTTPPQPTTAEPIIGLERMVALSQGQGYVYATAPRSLSETIQARLDEFIEGLPSTE
ncbi:MAG: hypothetical protein ACOYLB_02500 [Phototrophicaceae bacterium]